MVRNISLEILKIRRNIWDGKHNGNLLNLGNDDVVEEIKNLLVISKADHIEVLESSVDETGEVAKINSKTEIKDNEGNVIN